MRTGSASGIEIVVLSFAVILLAVPASNAVADWLQSSTAEAAFIGKVFPFLLGAIALILFPALRARTFTYLARRVPSDRQIELGLVAVGQVLLAFAFVGMMALWYWMTEGNSALEHHLRPKPHDTALRESLSGPGMLTSLVIGALLAPVIEEVLFRGLLFDAWARRWGAFVATILTSALFASYHLHFFASFTFAILFVCVVRRTGTLWGSIAVHSFYNLLMWYPLVGQFVFPDPQRATGDITTWGLNLACLLFAVVALPAYILLAVLRPHYPRPGTD